MSSSRSIEGADALYEAGAAAEIAGNFDKAFTSYFEAAQAYLHLTRSLPAARARDRERCRNAARTSLERAERIKAAKKDVLRPLTTDPFSETEQSFVLDKSSKIHGSLFPLWSSTSGSEHDDYELGGTLPLGPIPSSESPVWRRPHDVWSSNMLALASPALLPQSIRQNVVTDCSVCTAIAICLHHHRKFGSKLGLKSTFPQSSNELPMLASDGRYTFRFFMNGAFRRVPVNDLLPFDQEDRPISASAAHVRGGFDLWPSLVEKAYMSLMGGYDFPGSNSSIDAHAFTGWIPEQLETKSPSFLRERVWKRVKGGFQLGSCLVTLGTGVRSTPLSVRSSTGLVVGLLPTHSYAVLDIRENPDGSQRRVTFLDPWTTSPGTAFNSSPLSISSELGRLNLLDHSNSDGSSLGSVENGNGLVEAEWDEVCNAFDGIYLNWDPSLFKSSIEFHGSWTRKSKAESVSETLHQHLTLSLSSGSNRRQGESDKPEQTWILLTRHLVDKNRSGEYIHIYASEIEPLETTGRLDANESNSHHTLKATYTSSTHVLTRLTLSSADTQVAIVASYEGPYEGVCYTIQVFSARAQLSWVRDPTKPAYERTLSGSLTARNAGGNSAFPSFMNNPQYKLRLHSGSEKPTSSPTAFSPISPSVSKRASGQAMHSHSEQRKQGKSRLRIVVEGPRDVPLNVMLLWRNDKDKGERVLHLTDVDIISTSGAYTYGVAQTTATVMPGDYCVIISAFEPRHRGAFTLRIESSSRVDIEAIPSEGAGMFCKAVEGAWSSGNDVGSPQFGNYIKNPTYIIDTRVSTTLKIRLQLTKTSPAIALNVSLFASASVPTPALDGDGDGDGMHLTFTLGKLVSTSGAYVDSPAGAATAPVSLAPGRYLAVVSTFDPGARVQYRMVIYSSTDVEVSQVGRADAMSGSGISLQGG